MCNNCKYYRNNNYLSNIFPRMMQDNIWSISSETLVKCKIKFSGQIIVDNAAITLLASIIQIYKKASHQHLNKSTMNNIDVLVEDKFTIRFKIRYWSVFANKGGGGGDLTRQHDKSYFISRTSLLHNLLT